MDNKQQINKPQHIAIVMDGNGRWAKKQGKKRIFGHKKGARTALKILKYAIKKRIKYLTLYTFSSENWFRTKEEVSYLMKIIYFYIVQKDQEFIKNKIKFIVIGNKNKLPKILINKINKLEKKTKSFSNICLILALSYGARDEIIRAIKCIINKIEKGIIKKNEITENFFSSHLDTKNIPDPDLFIRTSGENRLSNFLLWQLSYSEIYITNILWPDFNEKAFDEALTAFKKRIRNFGLTH